MSPGWICGEGDDLVEDGPTHLSPGCDGTTHLSPQPPSSLRAAESLDAPWMGLSDGLRGCVQLPLAQAPTAALTGPCRPPPRAPGQAKPARSDSAPRTGRAGCELGSRTVPLFTPSRQDVRLGSRLGRAAATLRQVAS